jgi:competence protein ComEA
MCTPRSSSACPASAWSIVAVATLIVLALPVSARAQLPEGPGRAETVRMCGTCHPPERGASVRLTREGWEDVIARMVALGARGTDTELAAVLDYLSTHFEGQAAVPLNLNRATSVELESIAGFLRRESAAWMAYRTKRPCATVDDLKVVPGVDFKKVEKRRDRLVCF